MSKKDIKKDFLEILKKVILIKDKPGIKDSLNHLSAACQMYFNSKSDLNDKGNKKNKKSKSSEYLKNIAANCEKILYEFQKKRLVEPKSWEALEKVVDEALKAKLGLSAMTAILGDKKIKAELKRIKTEINAIRLEMAKSFDELEKSKVFSEVKIKEVITDTIKKHTPKVKDIIISNGLIKNLAKSEKIIAKILKTKKAPYDFDQKRAKSICLGIYGLDKIDEESVEGIIEEEEQPIIEPERAPTPPPPPPPPDDEKELRKELDDLVEEWVKENLMLKQYEGGLYTSFSNIKDKRKFIDNCKLEAASRRGIIKKHFDNKNMPMCILTEKFNGFSSLQMNFKQEEKVLIDRIDYFKKYNAKISKKIEDGIKIGAFPKGDKEKYFDIQIMHITELEDISESYDFLKEKLEDRTEILNILNDYSDKIGDDLKKEAKDVLALSVTDKGQYIKVKNILKKLKAAINAAPDKETIKKLKDNIENTFGEMVKKLLINADLSPKDLESKKLSELQKLLDDIKKQTQSRSKLKNSIDKITSNKKAGLLKQLQALSLEEYEIKKKGLKKRIAVEENGVKLITDINNKFDQMVTSELINQTHKPKDLESLDEIKLNALLQKIEDQTKSRQLVKGRIAEVKDQVKKADFLKRLKDLSLEDESKLKALNGEVEAEIKAQETQNKTKDELIAQIGKDFQEMAKSGLITAAHTPIDLESLDEIKLNALLQKIENQTKLRQPVKGRIAEVKDQIKQTDFLKRLQNFNLDTKESEIKKLEGDVNKEIKAGPNPDEAQKLKDKMMDIFEAMKKDDLIDEKNNPEKDIENLSVTDLKKKLSDFEKDQKNREDAKARINKIKDNDKKNVFSADLKNFELGKFLLTNPLSSDSLVNNHINLALQGHNGNSIINKYKNEINDMIAEAMKENLFKVKPDYAKLDTVQELEDFKNNLNNQVKWRRNAFGILEEYANTLEKKVIDKAKEKISTLGMNATEKQIKDEIEEVEKLLKAEKKEFTKACAKLKALIVDNDVKQNFDNIIAKNQKAWDDVFSDKEAKWEENFKTLEGHLQYINDKLYDDLEKNGLLFGEPLDNLKKKLKISKEMFEALVTKEKIDIFNDNKFKEAKDAMGNVKECIDKNYGKLENLRGMINEIKDQKVKEYAEEIMAGYILDENLDRALEDLSDNIQKIKIDEMAQAMLRLAMIQRRIDTGYSSTTDDPPIEEPKWD